MRGRITQIDRFYKKLYIENAKSISYNKLTDSFKLHSVAMKIIGGDIN